MLSQIGKGLHRSLAQRLCSGELWGLRQIQKKAEEFSSSFLPLPPVSFHEESGAPTGASAMPFSLMPTVLPLYRLECWWL